MSDPVCHYDTLQVARNAGDEVIRGAYRYLVQKWHPDRNAHRLEEAEQRIRIINEAYRVLSDPSLRREHDRWLDRRKAERRAAEARTAAAPPASWTQPPPALPEPVRQALVDSLSARHTWWILPTAGLLILWGAARILGPSLWNLVWALAGGAVASLLCSQLFALGLRRRDDARLQQLYARHRARTRGVLLLSLLAVGLAYLGDRGHFDGNRVVASLMLPWLTDASVDIDRRRLRPPCTADDSRVAGILPGTAASMRSTAVALPSACSP